MNDEFKPLNEIVQCQKDNAQNSIRRCREHIREIEKEISYYEGQRDEADNILHEIDKVLKGGKLPSPLCVNTQCDTKKR